MLRRQNLPSFGRSMLITAFPARLQRSTQQEVEMESHSHDLEHIQARLLKLERQNRRFKQLGAALVVIITTVLMMGQAVPSTKSIEAQEFILRDATGKIRAKLSMSEERTINTGTAEKPVPSTIGSTPTLNLYDDKAVARLTIEGDGTFLGSGFVLLGSNGNPVGSFHADQVYGATLNLANAKGKQGVFSYPGHLELTDDNGSKATLGVEPVTTSTGETHQTSAASLALFDKNKTVIWKAAVTIPNGQGSVEKAKR